MPDPTELVEPAIVNYWKDIADFHIKFGLKYTGPARFLPEDLHEFRLKFMQEELDEYEDAVHDKDMEKAFDALIDLVYVALGSAYLHGFPFPEGWVLVQTANMAKIRGTKNTSLRGSSYDVVKPEGWKAPKLTDLLKQTCL